MQFFYQLPHGRGLDIKTADRIAGPELLFYERIFFEGICLVNVDVDTPVLPDKLNTFPDMTQTALAKDVELMQADILCDEHVHHGRRKTFWRQVDCAIAG